MKLITNYIALLNNKDLPMRPVFEIISELSEENQIFAKTYQDVSLSEIPADVKYTHFYLIERLVIELGKMLHSDTTKIFRAIFPEKYTMIIKLWKKLRNETMIYRWNCSTIATDINYIGTILHYPEKDMAYIFSNHLLYLK